MEPDSDRLSFEEMSYWSTKEERRKWENDFVTAFARKVLMVKASLICYPIESLIRSQNVHFSPG